jgi:hypothetical protein
MIDMYIISNDQNKYIGHIYASVLALASKKQGFIVKGGRYEAEKPVKARGAGISDRGFLDN